MLSSKNIGRFILAFIVFFTIILSILIFLHPPALYPDPSWGFQVLRSMRMGGPFNILSSPNHVDISQNHHGFMSWWSPGQYLVPYFFIGVFKLNIGQAVAITITLCSLTGLRGLYLFFKKIGFTSMVSAISIAFICCQWAYFIPFAFYNGGETILFAFTGWFLLGCSCYTRINWQVIVFVLLSGIIGFICKSAFLWIYFAGVFYLWISLSKKEKAGKWLINGIGLAIPAVLSLAIIYLAYLSKGDNPAANVNGIKFTWEAFSFPIASPLLAAFSIDDLSNGIINYPAYMLLVLAIGSLAVVIGVCKNAVNANYRLLLIIFYMVAVLFYSINFLRQANISYEARHMRIVGLIITPGIIYLLGKVPKAYWAIFTLIWAFLVYTDYKFIYTGYNRNANWSSRGNTGLAQLFINQQTLNSISLIDKQQRNAIFIFNSPDLGLEINNNRIITLPELSDDLQPENDMDKYYGHAGRLYMVLPKSYIGAKAEIYFKNFPGYNNFCIAEADRDYVIYQAE